MGTEFDAWNYAGMDDQDNNRYRKQAADAQAMADKVAGTSDKEAWLKVAQGWLSLISKPRRTALEKFDDNTKVRGTGQTDSEESH